MGMTGVDIGRSTHYAVGLDADGKRLIARAVVNHQRDIDELVSWAAGHGASVVLDQPNGGAAALIQACWDHGVPVGYLQGLAMARARDFYEGEAKTVPKDAFVIADVAPRPRPTCGWRSWRAAARERSRSQRTESLTRTLSNHEGADRRRLFQIRCSWSAALLRSPGAAD